MFFDPEDDEGISPSYILPDDPPDIKPDVVTLDSVQGTTRSTEIAAQDDPLAINPEEALLVEPKEEANSYTTVSFPDALGPGVPALDAPVLSGGESASTSADGAWQLSTETNPSTGRSSSASSVSLIIRGKTWHVPSRLAQQHLCLNTNAVLDGALDVPMSETTPVLSGGTSSDATEDGARQLSSETGIGAKVANVADDGTTHAPSSQPANRSLLSEIASRLRAVEQNTDLILRLLETSGTTGSFSCNTTSKSNLVNRISTLEQKTDRILKLLQDPLALCSVNVKAIEECDFLFRDARSLHGVHAASGYHLVTRPNDKLLFCDICVKHFSPKLLQVRAPGVFQYDFNLGTVFGAKQKMPDMFRNMKECVRRHFQSPRHIAVLLNECSLDRVSEHSGRSQDADGTMRALRTMYYCLKKSLGVEVFEELVVLQTQNGIDMGDVRHSAEFMLRARNAFSGVMASKLRQHIDTQPCVSLLVDEVAISQQSLAIAAVMAVVPDAPSDHMVQSFLIGAPLLKSREDAMVGELQGSLASIGVTSTEKLASVSTAGHYQRSRVATKLLVGIREDDAGAPFAAVPVLDLCEAADLSLSDVQDLPGCDWVGATGGEIDSITKLFNDGKSMKILGKKLDIKVSQPMVWSESKKPAMVLAVFQGNILPMRKLLEHRLNVLHPSATDVESLRKQIRLLTDGQFLVRVAALRDICEVFGQGIRDVKAGRLQPWQSRKAYGKMVSSLQRMQRAILASHQTDPTAAQARDAADVKQCWASLCRCKAAPETLPSEVKNISGFCDALVETLQQRGEAVSAMGGRINTANRSLREMLPDIRNVSDLERIRDDKAASQAKRIGEAMERLAARGVIPSSAVAPESSVLAACDALHGELCAFGNNQELLKVLWHRRSTMSELQPYINTVIRLWLISPADGVTESMVSDIRELFGNHRQPSHSSAVKELCVRLNGPSLLKADPLIRTVQRETSFVFAVQPTKRAVNSSVISRHRAAKCPRSLLHV